MIGAAGRYGEAVSNATTAAPPCNAGLSRPEWPKGVAGETVLSSGTERRLAAVLSADVVGYTRLMHADEDGTHVRMMALRRDVVDPNVTIHAGRIVKSTGDGILAEFPSAVEAVVCAVEIQQLMATRNRSLPEPERIVFRFGLNMGEVIIEPDDIYGDAVNIAVRLQGIAPAGGLCVSQVVFDQVQHGLSFSLADYGPKSLKNISASIHAFGLEAEQIALLPESSLSTATNGSSRLAAPSNAAARHLAKRLSIAVLPFIDESGDKSQEYFCDGMVEEIITALSHFRSLFVIARNSSFLYRNRILDLRQIARELGVRYLVEGSIQRAADRVRIRANLIDTESGGHLWADRFDGDFTDVFSLQDRVATQIVTAIEPRVLQSEIEKARRKPAESLDAYDYYLHALPLRLALSAEATDEALRLLNKAIALDPSYAPALAHAASCHLALQDQG